MSQLEFVAVVLVCATLIACTWIVAERWYAHRDRAYTQFVNALNGAVTEAIHDTSRSVSRAVERLDMHVAADQASRDELAAQVKRLLDAEQARERERAFGRGRA